GEAADPAALSRRDRVGQAEAGFGRSARQAAARRRGGKPGPLLDRQKPADRARGQRQPDKPAAQGLAPALAGKARRPDQNRGHDQLEEQACSSAMAAGLSATRVAAERRTRQRWPERAGARPGPAALARQPAASAGKEMRVARDELCPTGVAAGRDGRPSEPASPADLFAGP